MDEWIFMKVTGYVGHDTINNLEDFDHAAMNLLDTWFIHMFHGSVFVRNITE